ncbi:MAG: PEP-CTERM sorting domain-containing protein [Acidobacteriota bacterium]|nr:PEP-CTERM sorting domain-containing protein [Bryobacteraceae bacterium CoA2 C42]MCA2964128.1 PEP-CTERM sorting domain-containing protein [Acidobacteriaceae bacterium]
MPRAVTPLSEPVPEPASFAFLGVGLAAIVCTRRRFR